MKKTQQTLFNKPSSLSLLLCEPGKRPKKLSRLLMALFWVWIQLFTQLRSSAHKSSIFNALSPAIALPACEIWAQATQDPDFDQPFSGTAAEARLEKIIPNTLPFSLFSLSFPFSSSSTQKYTQMHIQLTGRLWKMTNSWQYHSAKRTPGQKFWCYVRKSIWLDEEVSPWCGLGKGQQASGR